MRILSLFLSILLIVGEAQASLKSIEDSINLKHVLNVMSEVASEGASLTMFRYQESLDGLRNKTCTQVGAADVVAYLKNSKFNVDDLKTIAM